MSTTMAERPSRGAAARRRWYRRGRPGPRRGAAGRLLQGRRRRHLLPAPLALGLVLLLVGGFLGAAAATLVPTAVIGEVSLVLRPTPGNAFSERSVRSYVDLETEAELPRSDEVLQRLASTPGMALEPAELRSRISARPLERTEVLVISYRGEDRVQAAEQARLVAETVLEVRAERSAAAIADQTAVLEAKLLEADQDLTAAAGVDGDPLLVPTLSRRVASLRGSYTDVVGRQPSPGSVIAASATPDPGARQLQLAVVAAGAGGGALIGVGWGLGRARRRIRR